MPLDPAISLSVAQPQITNPVDQFTKAIALRDMISQAALRQQQIQQSQAQTQQSQAEAQQKQRDLTDQQSIATLLKDPDVAKQVYGGDLSPIYSLGLQPKTVDSVRTAVNTALDNETTRGLKQLQVRDEAFTSLGKTLDAVDQLRNPDGSHNWDHINASLPSLYQSHAPEFKAVGIDPSHLPTHLNSDEDLNNLTGLVGVYGARTQAALARLKEQGATAESTSKAAQAQAAANLDNYKLSLLKGGQGNDTDAGALMDQLFAGKPDLRAQADKVYQTAKSAANPLKDEIPTAKGLDAVKAFYDEQVAKPQAAVITQAQLEPGEVKKAVDTETATAPIKVQEQVNAEIQKAKQAPGGFAAITDPNSRTKAETTWEKAANDYADSVSRANSILSTIDAAQKGNRSAPAVLPIEVLRTFINRPNIQELRGVGNAGSWLDKVQGFINGAKEGDPIPPAVLDGMRGIAQIQKDTAVQKYDMSLNTVKGLGGDTTKLPDIKGLAGGVQAAPSALSTGHRVGDPVYIKGKGMQKITKIYPDGSFDAN